MSLISVLRVNVEESHTGAGIEPVQRRLFTSKWSPPVTQRSLDGMFISLVSFQETRAPVLQPGNMKNFDIMGHGK